MQTALSHSSNPTPRVRRRITASSIAAPSMSVQVHEPTTPEAPRFDDAALRVSSLDSHALLRGHKTVQIAHNGFVYTLQATKLGKLILTK
ncbi:hemin uptake protein HemP [Variovorax sp. LT1R16]|uniref:hemin uptake protein HemP n=1 Tax=Variovorax sp. LT1R16 TaxID=3443728 RepID=UPI003F45E8E6